MNWMRDMARWLMAAMLFVFGLTIQQAQAAAPNEYALGPGDQIRILVYQNQDLSLETRITEDGSISYPLLGSVKLGGLTVTEAEKKIATGLKEGNFLKQPQVTVILLTPFANQVSVLGQVNKPGRFGLIAGTQKLSEVIAAAGGIVPGAGSDVVVVSGLRDGKPFRKEIDFPKLFSSYGTQEDMMMQNGDTVWVDRAPIVYIYGEVQRPGAQALLRDMTVLQALASSGGLTLRGTQRGIRVHRRDPTTGEVKVIQPDMNDKLMPNDIIYVKESLF